jgi:hypothetical protein
MQVDEIGLFVAAAFGDNAAILNARHGLEGHKHGISAAMVAAANGQTNTCSFLNKKYPDAPTQTKYKTFWYKTACKLYEGQVVLPVSALIHVVL